ncbi:MAG: methyl-accepting chemotaxis protein [Brevinema sp.]
MAENFSSEKKQSMTRSLKFRMFMVVLAVSVLITVIVSLQGNSLRSSLRNQSHLSYIYKTRGIIQEIYMGSVYGEQQARQQDAIRRAQSVIEENTFTDFVLGKASANDPVGAEMLALQELARQAVRSANDSVALEALFRRSAQYPSIEVYRIIEDSKLSDFSNLGRNMLIVGGVIFFVMFILFVVLQILAKGIGMIAFAARGIAAAADSGVMDVSKRVHLQLDDETRDITDGLNHFFEVLEFKVAEIRLQIDRAYYQAKCMSGESEGSSLEIKVINSSVERMNRQIRSQISSVTEAVAALEEMERTLDVIFSNISRQSSAMTQSAATLEEMGRQIEGIANISNDTSDLAKNLTNAANKGSVAVESSVLSIRDVAEYSGQIIKLLKLISDIAKQTNLLAMNASIEAAHAGEAGRGFAIVAEEIRRLSETTNKNAKEIRTVVDTMVEKIENSVTQAQTAGEDLGQITRYAGDVEDRVAQLNQMLQEQNVATQETIQTIESLVTLSQEIKLSMEEQQYALNEYGTTMNVLSENFNDTESTLNSHTSSVDNLLQIMIGTRRRITINQECMDSAMKVLEQFVLTPELQHDSAEIAEEQDKRFKEEVAVDLKQRLSLQE